MVFFVTIVNGQNKFNSEKVFTEEILSPAKQDISEAEK